MNVLLSRLPKFRTRTLPALMMACGALCLIFRLLLIVTGLDDKGLLIPWHFTWICLWLVTITAGVILVLGVLPIRGPAAYRSAFPRSLPAAVGCGLGTLMTLKFAVELFHADLSLMVILQGTLSVLAAISFALVGFCRLSGKKPTFLFHVVICAWLVLQVVGLYQSWSISPKIYAYIFQILACIALTATAYQLAAFDMGKGSHRKLWAAGLAAIYLCSASIFFGEIFIFGVVWATTNLTNLRRPRNPRPTEPEELPAAE